MVRSIRLPVLLAAAAMMGSCSAKGTAELRRDTVYRCADGRSFSVIQALRTASVTYDNRRYVLPRKTSGIGLRFASPKATLIIDGDMAVFVTPRVLDLHACRASRA